MSKRSRVFRVTESGGLALVLAGMMVVQVAAPAAQGDPVPHPAEFQGLLTQYCVACHNDQAMRGGLTLQGRDLVNLSEDAEVWEKVIRKVRGGFMPPPGRPRPDLDTRNAFVTALETEIDQVAARTPAPPVRATRQSGLEGGESARAGS